MILLGVALGIPMFLVQIYGTGFVTLLLPLAIMTMGFGFTNVGATTFALQAAPPAAKGLESRPIARFDFGGPNDRDRCYAAC